MIVITLTNCPQALRGDLTIWLQEISSGVFVGNVSARVRDELWARIQHFAKDGRATMVFSTNNEQHMDFRVQNENWEPIDFDGLKLMLHSNPTHLATKVAEINLKNGFSKAAKFHKAKQMAGGKKAISGFPMDYLVIDLETSGLNPLQDQIIEIGAMIVKNGETFRSYQAFILHDEPLTPTIQKLTGITDELLRQQGRQLKTVLEEFIDFVGAMPVVSHNSSFDYNFLRASCIKCGLPPFANPCTDTLALARKLIKDVMNYKLATLAKHLDLEIVTSHRTLDDCLTTKLLYEKLIKLEKEPNRT